MGLFDRFYPDDNELRRLLLSHSRSVAMKALAICDSHPQLPLRRTFVEAAAMLHDIGICQCSAPGICCHGHLPYIQHGLAGAEMLRSLASTPEAAALCPQELWEPLARVCQRHTGAGITRAEVLAQGLPLPLPGDGSEPYMPETLEEKLICYADKFFSKTKLDREKTVDEAVRSLAKFGDAGVARFLDWQQLFG